MPLEVTIAQVEQFASNVQLKSQQLQHKFAGKVRQETQQGRVKNYEQFGVTEFEQITTRKGDTPDMDDQWGRRKVTMKGYHWGKLIDEEDKLRMLVDPESTYVRAAVAGANRMKDRIIINAALGKATAVMDEDENTEEVELPESQIITGDTNSGMSLDKLMEAANLFGVNDVREDARKFFVISQYEEPGMQDRVDALIQEVLNNENFLYRL